MSMLIGLTKYKPRGSILRRFSEGGGVFVPCFLSAKIGYFDILKIMAIIMLGGKLLKK